MDPVILGRLLALGRVGIGAALVVAPGFVGERWIGGSARRAGARAVLTAVGARDLALGLGAAWALGGGEPARRWLLAGVVADAADLAATVRHRDEISPAAFVSVTALAGGGVALGLWLAAELD